MPANEKQCFNHVAPLLLSFLDTAVSLIVKQLYTIWKAVTCQEHVTSQKYVLKVNKFLQFCPFFIQGIPNKMFRGILKRLFNIGNFLIYIQQFKVKIKYNNPAIFSWAQGN